MQTKDKTPKLRSFSVVRSDRPVGAKRGVCACDLFPITDSL